MNKPSFQLKPLGAALRLQNTQKKQVSTIQRNIHKQFYNSLTDTPTEQAILLSQSTSYTGAHLMQPIVKHMRLRIVAFVSQLPED